jgi:(5-formylfuran-3-yl)methyl phosphate synthase
MTRLLVSVRSVIEARAALAGGAAIIDVKEPSHGSLGRARNSTIHEVTDFVARAQRRKHGIPVSAALGELAENSEPLPSSKLDYVKWGLAGMGAEWQRKLLQATNKMQRSHADCQPVPVAYADWRQAQSPLPQAILGFVIDHSWTVFLLDTWQKDGRTLLDWITLREISQLCRECHRHGIRLALAGSLRPKQITRLLRLDADIIAVRGAACRGDSRLGMVDAARVRRLVDLLTPSPATLAD